MMLETYVAQNLTGILHSTWPRADICFWNIQGRHEVDFVIRSGKKCVAIEIKAAARWDSKDLTGLKAFMAATPHCIAGVRLQRHNPDQPGRQALGDSPGHATVVSKACGRGLIFDGLLPKPSLPTDTE